MVVYWFPKTKIGRISFWVGVSAFVLLYVQYWLAMLFQTSIIFPGLLALFCILVAGASSILALTKYKDRSILLFVPALIGCFGLLLVLGEFLFPH